MKSKLLLPYRFKWIGLVLLIPFLIVGILNRYNGLELSFLTVYSAKKDFLFQLVALLCLVPGAGNLDPACREMRI